MHWYRRLIGLWGLTLVALVATLVLKGGWDAAAAGFAAFTGVALVVGFAAVEAAADRRVS